MMFGGKKERAEGKGQVFPVVYVRVCTIMW